MHQAKTELSKLLRRVLAGEEVVITRSGKSIAKLVPASDPTPRVFGTDEGKFSVPPDFNDPLPDELLAEFER